MTKSNSDKLNWGYVMLGLFFGIILIWPNNNDIAETELETQKIVVSQNIQKIGGRRSKYEYRIWSNDYPCSFVIRTAGGIAAHWENLDNITKNDTLIIKIHNSRRGDLSKKHEDIPVYSLINNNRLVYDFDSYIKSQKKYDSRWNIIFLIMSILLILRGLAIISSVVSFILAILSLTVIIILRQIGIW